jgi:hypothetical protein
LLGRTGLRYLEGERSVWIESEVLAKPRAIALATASIRYWEGPGAELVDEAARNRIAGNIKRAFDACGHELEIHGPFDWCSVAMRPPKERPE